MSDKPVYSRPGIFGPLLNKIKPLKHAPNRRDRLMKAINENKEADAINIIQKEGLTPQDYDDGYFIHSAAAKNQVGVVNALIEAKADVDIANEDLRRPLDYAAKRGHADVVSALLKGGANATWKDPTRHTPLYGAVQRGVDLSLEAALRDPPVELEAAAGGHLKTARLLLAARPPPNIGEIREFQGTNFYDALFNKSAQAEMPATASGGRKRTRKHRKSKRKTRCSRK